MKKLLLILCLIVGDAGAQQTQPASPTPWIPSIPDIFLKADPFTVPQMVAEGAFDAELIIDAHQTNSMRSMCAAQQGCSFRELNPFLGTNPGAARVRNYFVGEAITHGIITLLLPTAYRTYWQSSTHSIEVSIIGANKQIGLGFKF